MKQLLAILLIASASLAFGQREYLEDRDEIVRRAAAELDASMQPGGNIHKVVLKENLRGVYQLQISISDKGDIRSVSVLDRQGGDIPSQNRFKQLVHDARFSSFKTPKGKQYRFEHRFDLDALHGQ